MQYIEGAFVGVMNEQFNLKNWDSDVREETQSTLRKSSVMLSREIIAVFCRNLMKLINTQ